MKVKKLKQLLAALPESFDNCEVVWPLRHPNGFASVCHPFSRVIKARLKIDQMVESARIRGIDYKTRWLSQTDYEYYKSEPEKMEIDLYKEDCVVLC